MIGAWWCRRVFILEYFSQSQGFITTYFNDKQNELTKKVQMVWMSSIPSISIDEHNLGVDFKLIQIRPQHTLRGYFPL